MEDTMMLMMMFSPSLRAFHPPCPDSLTTSCRAWSPTSNAPGVWSFLIMTIMMIMMTMNNEDTPVRFPVWASEAAGDDNLHLDKPPPIMEMLIIMIILTSYVWWCWSSSSSRHHWYDHDEQWWTIRPHPILEDFHDKYDFNDNDDDDDDDDLMRRSPPTLAARNLLSLESTTNSHSSTDPLIEMMMMTDIVSIRAMLLSRLKISTCCLMGIMGSWRRSLGSF